MEENQWFNVFKGLDSNAKLAGILVSLITFLSWNCFVMSTVGMLSYLYDTLSKLYKFTQENSSQCDDEKAYVCNT